MNNGDVFSVTYQNKKVLKKKITQLKIANIDINDMLQDQQGMFFLINKKCKTIQYQTKNISLKSGILETSNVNPSTIMINLISNARLFEMNMKTITNYDKIVQQSNQILNIHG